MLAFLLFAIPIVLLVVASWIVAAARPWIRVTAVVVAMSLTSYLSFSLGAAIERGRFVSSHLHWFIKYSAYLHQLADQHDATKLMQVVTQFDERFQQNPQDTRKLEDTMYEMFDMGPYYKDAK
jgi:hypothetical protein